MEIDWNGLTLVQAITTTPHDLESFTFYITIEGYRAVCEYHDRTWDEVFNESENQAIVLEDLNV